MRKQLFAAEDINQWRKELGLPPLQPEAAQRSGFESGLEQGVAGGGAGSGGGGKPPTGQGGGPIDFDSDEPYYLAKSTDLRSVFPPESVGHTHARSLPTYLEDKGKAHLRNDHPERIEWLHQNVDVIKGIVENPRYVSRSVEFREDTRHWVMLLADEVPGKPGKFMVLVISLANLPGEIQSRMHTIRTIYPARQRDFYKGGQLRDGDWIELGQQKTGP